MSEPENESWSKAKTIVVFLAIGLFVAVAANSFFAKPRSSGPTNPCINIMRQMDAAKQEWALENGKTNGVVCTENDLTPYIKLDAKGNLPQCPQGGKYTIGKVGEPVTCSLGTTVTPPHVLP
jgi:hypothetical protein